MLQFGPNDPEELVFTLHKADQEYQTHRIYILDLDGTMMPSSRLVQPTRMNQDVKSSG